MEEKAKKKLLQLLKTSIEYFEANDISYFAGYGTCLGAIRHKGLIPWDDDVDLCVTRKGFDKLLSCRSDFYKKTGYKIVSLKDKGFYSPHVKIIDTTSTLQENEYYPFLIGIFIDIFPLDLTSDPENIILQDKNDLKDIFDKYAKSISKLSFISQLKRISHGNVRTIMNYWMDAIHYRPYRKELLEHYLSKNKVLNKENGIHYVNYVGPYKERDIFKREWVEKTRIVEYENLNIRIPFDYHDYLSHIYGDYMTPPPIDKRIAHTQFYFSVDKELN